MNDPSLAKWSRWCGAIRIRTLLAVLSGGLFVGAIISWSVDTDSDGMDDDYEAFFGLNTNDPADALLNNDSDALTNSEEAVIWTDPFEGDTDADGWLDDADNHPLSRAVMLWGDPQFSIGDDYTYTGPSWWLGGRKDGGVWSNNSWQVPASETNSASLLIDVDRAVLTNSLRMNVTLWDYPSSELVTDLLDTNSVIVATNVNGNLTTGSSGEVVRSVSVDLPSNPSASIIRLRRTYGEVAVFETVLYIDEDVDGLDLQQEQQLGTSDDEVDSDGDGYSDGYEIVAGTDPADEFSVPVGPVIITLPADVTIECDAASGPGATGYATAINDCDGDPALSYADTAQAGACTGAETIYRTWSATNDCGHALSATQQIVVADTTAPVLTCSSPPSLTNAGFESGNGQSITGWNRFGPNTYHEGIIPKSGSYHAKIFGANSQGINYSGWYQDLAANSGELWRASMWALNPTADPIVGNSKARVLLEFYDASYVQLASHASTEVTVDSIRGTYQQLAVSGTAPSGAAYARIVGLFEQHGQAGGSVYFDDASLSLLEVSADSSCQAVAPDLTPWVSASDACDPAPSVSQNPLSGSTIALGTQSLVMASSDSCGNNATCSFSVTVVDDTPPVLSCDHGELQNRGFEKGNGPPSQPFDGKTIENWGVFGGVSPNVYHEKAAVRSGAFHLKIYGQFTGSENYSGVFQDLPAAQGEYWRASTFVYLPSGDALAGGNKARVQLEFLDGSYGVLASHASSDLTSASTKDLYTEVVSSGVAPSNTVYARLVCMFVQDGSSGGSAYFDDAVLTRYAYSADTNCQATVPNIVAESSATDSCDSAVMITQVPAAGTTVDPGHTEILLRATDDYGNVSEKCLIMVVDDETAPTVTSLFPELENAGFEIGGGAGSQEVDGWHYFGPNALQGDGHPRNGSNHIEIAGAYIDIANYSGWYQDLNAAEGQAWRAHIWASSTFSSPILGDSRARLQLEFLDVETNLLSSAPSAELDSETPAGIYIPLVVSAVAPSNTAFARLVAQFEQRGNAGGSVCFDDATLSLLTASADTNCQVLIPDLRGTVTASDYCDGTLTIEQFPAPGTLLSTGDHTLVFTSTDDAGNTGNAVLHYSVRDDAPPVLDSPWPALTNPSFEKGNGPPGVPNDGKTIGGWSPFGGTELNVYHEKVAARSGDFHAKVFGSFSGSKNYNGLYQDLPAVQGEFWYAETFAVLPSMDSLEGDSLAYVQLEFLNSSNVLLGQVRSRVLSTDDPRDAHTRLQASAIAPTNTATARIVCMFEHDGASLGSVFFDDAVLTKVASAADANCAGVVSNVAASATASDLCDGAPALVQSPVASSAQGVGVQQILLQASDAAGNLSFASVHGTIVDAQAPLLSCPADITLSCADSLLPVHAGTASATDECDESPAVTYEDRSTLFLSSGLALYLEMDELLGTNAADASLFGRDGALHGVMAGATGQVSYATGFDGDDYIDTGAWSPGGSELSISAWVKPGGGSNQVVLGQSLSATNTAPYYAWALKVATNSSFALQVGSVSIVSPDYQLTNGVWQHVAGVYDGASLSLYHNGQSVGTGVSASGEIPSSSQNVRLGSRHTPDSGDGEYFMGFLDEAAVWGRALDADEVADLLSRGGAGLPIRVAGTTNDPLVIERVWQAVDNFSNQSVCTQRVTSVTCSTDSDGDGISDADEHAYGTDPAAADSDGDGVTDMDELTTHGTDPLLADTDGDGLTDGWEVSHALDPLNSDANDDPDGDFLVNRLEFYFATDPNDADSDNDGVNDFVETKVAYSDPLVVDYDGTYTVEETIPGSSFTTNAIGEWGTWGDEVYSRSIRGGLEYDLTLPASGVYRIQVEGMGEPLFTTKLLAFIDGEYLGYNYLPVSPDPTNTTHFFTPHLDSGSHKFLFVWDNVNPGARLGVSEIELHTVGGPDTNGVNGVDWLEHRLNAIASVDSASANSKVSPYCLEGNGRFLGAISLSSGTEVRKGAGHRWFSDVPLPSSGSTNLGITLENGARSNVSTISWVAHNVITESNLTIRAGDSLKLTAYPAGATGGTVTIIVPGFTNASTSVAAPVICDFPLAGEYPVFGIHNDGLETSNTITVTVLDAAFPTNAPAVWAGKQRSWPCPDVATTGIQLEADPNLRFIPTSPIFGTNAFHLDALTSDDEHAVVARLPGDGSILDSQVVQSFWIGANVDGYFHIVGSLSDGTQIIENRFLSTWLPTSVLVEMQVLAGGVTFGDGNITQYFTSWSLPPTGEYIYTLLVPEEDPKACHRIRAFQDGQFIGER